jgi:molybdenum cofactor cytidylyltransferase
MPPPPPDAIVQGFHDPPPPRGAPVAVIVGLLVAAGYGRRFDPSGAVSKLETRIGTMMVAVRTARPLLASCDRVIAAVRPESKRLAEELAAAGCDIAPVTGSEGMGTSIACGARVAASIEGLRMLLVQPADMPWLEAEAVQRIVQAQTAEGELIVVPTYHGHDGHPVRFDHSLVPALARLGGERGARPLLLLHPPLRVPVDHPGVVRDLDTSADLARPADFS